MGQELTPSLTRKAQASLMLRKVGSYLLWEREKLKLQSLAYLLKYAERKLVTAMD